MPNVVSEAPSDHELREELLLRSTWVNTAISAFFRLHPRWHGFIAVPQIIAVVLILMTAVFAFVREVHRNLRLLGKEVILSVSRNDVVNAFGATVLASENPLWLGSHAPTVGFGSDKRIRETIDINSRISVSTVR